MTSDESNRAGGATPGDLGPERPDASASAFSGAAPAGEAGALVPSCETPVATCEVPAVAGSPSRRPIVLDVLQFVLSFALVLGVIWVLRIFVVEPFTIPTGSMLPTIQLQDSVYAEKVSLWFDDEPQVGQVYTFTNPEDPSETLIKRVIAVGGQTIDLRDGHVYVDGVELDEPYVHGQDTVAMRSTAGVTYPYTIPEGEFWAMGDNRGNSSDSRVFGSVPYENLIARAVYRYWPIFRLGDPVEIDMGLFTFTAYPLELSIGALDYT